MFTEFLYSLPDKCRVLDRRRAQNHPFHAVCEVVLRRAQIADTAAQFDLQSAVARHLQKYRAVLRRAGLRAIQVHHVNPLRTGLPESTRGFQWILRHALGGRKVALIQPHAGALVYVNRGKNNHVASPPKFLRIASPTSALFSGWNCAPNTSPFATSAGTSMP